MANKLTKEETMTDEQLIESLTPLEAHNILLQTGSHSKAYETLTNDRKHALLHYAEQVGYYKRENDDENKVKMFHTHLSKLAAALAEGTEGTKMPSLLVELAQKKNAVEFQSTLYSKLQTKVQEALDVEKKDLAKYMFGEVELDPEDLALGEGLLDSKDEELLPEKYMGFSKLKSSLAHKGAHSPGALAAWIGDRKWGKKKMHAAAAGHHKVNEVYDNPGHLHAPEGDPSHEANKGGFKAADVSVHKMPEPSKGTSFGHTTPSETKKTRAFKEPAENGSDTNSGT